MKQLLTIAIIFFLLGCTKKKTLQEQKIMHEDSAKIDSINYIQKKQSYEKLNGILLDGRLYTPSQLDSIFTGQK